MSDNWGMRQYAQKPEFEDFGLWLKPKVALPPRPTPRYKVKQWPKFIQIVVSLPSRKRKPRDSRKARQVWIKHKGVIPDGYHIHHIDGDPMNNDITNLACLSLKQHIYVHERQGNTQAVKLLRKAL
jgi:hypothetical protein